MKVSIITLTYNSKDTITQTVRSILSQDYDQIEHIIIDNESSDGTLDIVKDLYKESKRELIIQSEKDKGISDGFNKGIKLATGDIVALLNSDDSYLDSEVISDVVDSLQDESIDFAHGDMLFVDDEYGTNERKPLLCSVEKAMPFNHPTMFLKRKIYDDVGVYDLSYRYAMDFHLVCRMHKNLDEMKFKGEYLTRSPLVEMKAGGISWSAEAKSLEDIKRALEESGFYTNKARCSLALRLFRIKLKNLLTKLNLFAVIKIWRNLKW